MSACVQPTSSMPPFVTRAPRDVAGWLRLFDASTLPVLATTAATIETLRPVEDEVDAHLLAEAVARDPLMTLKLLAHVGLLRRGRGGSEIETATEALVMLGIPPFFRTFDALMSVEEHLAALPEALQGMQQVLRRAHRAARFAIGFAVHRMDHDAEVIHEAALLHDFAELLLWVRAPAFALEILHRQDADPSLRSHAVQQDVLNVTLPQLQHALMVTWRLSSLLVRITDENAPAADAQLRNVQLAVRIARHSAHGWDNPALPDDVRELGALLQLGVDPTLRLLHDIDDEDG